MYIIHIILFLKLIYFFKQTSLQILVLFHLCLEIRFSDLDGLGLLIMLVWLVRFLFVLLLAVTVVRLIVVLLDFILVEGKTEIDLGISVGFVGLMAALTLVVLVE
jgi:hypothetical protein